MLNTGRDQAGRIVSFPDLKPKRIISLVPSQTELLYDLGLDEEVVGITKFCVHPQHWRKIKTIVGGTKNISLEKVKVLNPDLIIANKEENVKEQVEALEQIAPVWTSDVNNLEDALKMILMIGEITDEINSALKLSDKISTAFSSLNVKKSFLRTAYLIWQNPYMTIGGDTFIGDMLRRCRMTNVFETCLRYPETTLNELSALDCNLILLSSEPYPFKEKHIHNIKVALPQAVVKLVDGEMFSWYGSRLLEAAEYFKHFTEDLSKA